MLFNAKTRLSVLNLLLIFTALFLYCTVVNDLFRHCLMNHKTVCDFLRIVNKSLFDHLRDFCLIFVLIFAGNIKGKPLCL